MALIDDASAPADGATGWLSSVEYDMLNRDEVVAALAGLDVAELRLVAERERAGRSRVTVLRRIDALLARYDKLAAGPPAARANGYPAAVGQVLYDSRDFNVPPGWPTPPPGWVPPAGWTPDSAWPAPPFGWVFWTDREPGSSGVQAPSSPSLAPVTATCVSVPFTAPSVVASTPVAKPRKSKGPVVGLIVGICVLVAIVAALASGSGSSAGGSVSSSGLVGGSNGSGYLDPQSLASDLQAGITAQLNDPTSDIYNDPDSDTYDPGLAMGPITCIQLMPASNDQFSCMGDYTDGIQWSKTVQVSSDGSSYQTIGS